MCSAIAAVVASVLFAASAGAQDASMAQRHPRALRTDVSIQTHRPSSLSLDGRYARLDGVPQQRRCALRKRDWLLYPAVAVAGMALPVAGVAALVADQRARAATGALIAGAAYAVPATVVLAKLAPCSSTSPVIYIWTIPAAIVGAVIGAH